MEIYLATQNKHKIEELSALLQGRFSIKSVFDLGIEEEIPENGKTIAENSLQKAQFIASKYGVTCLSDDSGLEVEALGGAPGVYSARFAGPEKNDKANIQLLLNKLTTNKNKNARFVTVLTFHYRGQFIQFEGEIQGKIIEEERGNSGFGYDPVFVPEGFNQTFAEMSMQEKNLIAHRAKALDKFLKFIDEQTNFSNFE